ncbi:MAG: hypothetical protein IKE03_09280 [Blautia sp.]|nr:hypothetical protein [Blautia sp.]
MKIRKAAILMTAIFSLGMVSPKAEEKESILKIEDGALQPIWEVTTLRDPGYTNEGSDILRFCVYVETDNDTDNDKMADLVKVLVQVPRAAAEGKYKAGTIYDPTPYGAGTIEEREAKTYYREEAFDYKDLYRDCEKREPAGEMDSLEAAGLIDPYRDWNYTVPGTSETGMSYADCYDYYLSRGYAIVEACGIGTYGSEGFELCGTNLERDSHKAVVEWVAGNRRAFTDRTQNIEIKADWSNGKVAMTGCSYGGTLPFEVATTGVEGLATIIPSAGIASWYDYTNSQGAATIFDVNYADTLAFNNCGACFLDKDWLVMNKEYASWLWQIAKDQEATNGNYGPIWEESDYSDDWEQINCSALIVHGLNDMNVTTKQSDLMMQAFMKAGKTAKLVLHQDAHNTLDNRMVNGELWNEIQNRWLAHYLYDVDNDAEQFPTVLVQSNLDGEWKSYDTWRDFTYSDVPAYYEGAKSVVSSKDLAPVAYEYLQGGEDYRDAYYTNLTGKHAAIYPLELDAGETIYGVPEIHLSLSSEIMEYEGLMITAVLVDLADDFSDFDAYVTKDAIGQKVPVRIIGEYEGASSWGSNSIEELVQDSVYEKNVSYGWTDLTNPGLGYDSSEYTETQDIEAGEFYDYTIYMLPTVYTLAPGHHLSLVLTTWDPYRAFLDESFEGYDLEKTSEEIDYDYSYIIDNEAIRVRMPLA